MNGMFLLFQETGEIIQKCFQCVQGAATSKSYRNSKENDKTSKRKHMGHSAPNQLAQHPETFSSRSWFIRLFHRVRKYFFLFFWSSRFPHLVVNFLDTPSRGKKCRIVKLIQCLAPRLNTSQILYYQPCISSLSLCERPFFFCLKITQNCVVFVLLIVNYFEPCRRFTKVHAIVWSGQFNVKIRVSKDVREQISSSASTK